MSEITRWIAEYPEIVVGVVYFLSVFAKAFQQRNVAFVNYLLLVPMSYLLAAADVTVFSMIAWKAASTDSIFGMLLMIFAIGTGGALGSLLATWLHHKYFTKERFK